MIKKYITYGALSLAIIFGCGTLYFSIPEKEPSDNFLSMKIPNPYGADWWVCAYCGKKYENGETSCPCHVRKSL